MKTEQIKQVLEIYKTGSINKASHNLFIAQSTLSSSMNVLEKEMGQKIFIRNKHGVKETEYGKEFIKLAEEMQSIYQKMCELASETKMQQEKKRFCVSICYLEFAVRLFIEIYNEYRDENTEFQFHECTRSQLLRYVATGNSELGVFALPYFYKNQWLELFAANGLEYFKITTESPKILMRKDHPVALEEKNPISFQDLKKYSLFYYEEDNEIFNIINQSILKRYHIDQYICFSGKGVREMLLKTDGYLLGAFNENAYRENIYDENICVFDLEEEDLFHYEIGYIKKIDTPLSKLGEMYLYLLKNKINGT